MMQNSDARMATTNADDWRLGRDEPAPVEELKGQALDDALRAAGLPLTGTADEKRARLAGAGDTPSSSTPGSGDGEAPTV